MFSHSHTICIFRLVVQDGGLGAHDALTCTVGRFHSSLC